MISSKIGLWRNPVINNVIHQTNTSTFFSPFYPPKQPPAWKPEASLEIRRNSGNRQLHYVYKKGRKHNPSRYNPSFHQKRCRFFLVVRWMVRAYSSSRCFWASMIFMLCCLAANPSKIVPLLRAKNRVDQGHIITIMIITLWKGKKERSQQPRALTRPDNNAVWHKTTTYCSAYLVNEEW